MADLNRVFLMGRLTHDPELRYTGGGTAVTDLRLATSRTWMGKDGESKKETLYIDITVWNRQAENCCQYLKKGSAIHVEGYLKMESWQSPTGENRTKVKVEADRVQFLERRDGGGGDFGGGGDGEYSAPAPAPRRAPEPRASNGPSRSYSNAGSAPARPAAPSRPIETESEDEDIPF